MNKRIVSNILWVDPEDCDPPHDLDMESEHDRKKVEDLIVAFQENGFDESKPALVGYAINGQIQLLSGTHRHCAAYTAGIKIPVRIFLRSDVDDKWGTDEWQSLIEDVPVKDLLEIEAQESDDTKHRERMAAYAIRSDQSQSLAEAYDASSIDASSNLT